MDVDEFLQRETDVRKICWAKCNCGHRDDEVGKGHQRCDFLVASDDDSYHLVLIEVKTGERDPDRDIAKGFSQLICSKCVFLSVLRACSATEVDWHAAGLVVTRVASIADDAEPKRIEWSRRFRIRLKHVLSGTDIWDAAFGKDS